MALGSKIIKRITGVKGASDAAHTSGYAMVQNGNHIGASSTQSFSERRAIDHNRTMVQSYRDSMVATGGNVGPKAMSEEEKYANEMARRAKEAAKHSMSLQEYNSNLEKGGLMKYDTRTRGGLSAAQEVSKTRGFGRMSAAEMRQNRQAAAQYRQAQADRFSGGVKTYQGGPKPFTGGTGIRPRTGR